MCEYCKCGVPLMAGDDIDDGRVWIDIDGLNVEIDQSVRFVEIAYCPMCGHNLGGDAS